MSIVHLKNKKNGVTYVYESSAYWDKEKGQARNSRICNGNSIKPGPVPVTTHQRHFYGATYLFDKIGEQLGVYDDLKICFPDSYKQILSIAYYLILEARAPLSRFVRWGRTHEHPYGKEIASQRSSELFGSVSEDAKQRFFSLQSARRSEEEYLAYDTTSVSSYSHSLKQVRYGVNKDHDPLAQINLALLLGQTSRLPVCYRKLPGNISDVKTIKKLLSDVAYLNIKKVKLVLDRGFYSQANVNAMYQHHYKFLLGVKTSLKFVKKHLDDVKDTMVTRANYSARHALYYQSFSTEWNYTEVKARRGEILKEKRRIYLHLYYNDQRATDEKLRFNKMLDQLEEELLSNTRVKKHELLYQRYFTIHETPVRGVQLSVKEDAIKAKEERFGYFALISNGIKDPLEAIDVYRSKDLIEKAYDDLKNRLSLRRTSVSSEERLDGKLFVQFIALIYVSYIKQKMDEEGLFKQYTLQGVLDELDIIERFRQPNKKPIVGEVTKKQQKLYELFGVEAVS